MSLNQEYTVTIKTMNPCDVINLMQLIKTAQKNGVIESDMWIDTENETVDRTLDIGSQDGSNVVKLVKK